ncbi:hypothetical protein HpRN165_05330 [Helicobacter pylori]
MNTKGAVGDISNDERPNHASDTRTKRAIHNAHVQNRTKTAYKREPKKSVLEPELKNILTPKTPTHN